MGGFGSPVWRRFLLGLLLVAATLALYFPASHHPFVNYYDDDQYVTDNVHVQSGLDWYMVSWAFTTYHALNWHPLTWLSHALDCQLYGLNPGGHHVTNICLHGLNVVLLFWLLLRATARTGRSLMVAALFAVHPINVESVVWIAERKNLLSMLFFLLSLAAYRWYGRDFRVGRYVVVALLFALGLMAKPQVITLPFVLLLWDYWPLQRMFFETSSSAAGASAASRGTQFWRLIVEKAPLFALAGISAVITMHAQRPGINSSLSLAPRLENAIIAYARYLGKAFWPASLSPIYPHPGTLLPLWQVLAALFILATVTALVVARRRDRYLPVGWFWFLGTLVPMVGVVQVGRQALADRYAYLPFVGLFIMICWAVADWAEDKNISPAWLAGPSVAVLIALAAMSYRQISYWNDNVVLWTYTFHITKGYYAAEFGLAEALLAHGQPELSMAHFQAVASFDSPSPPAFRRDCVAHALRAHMYIGSYEQQHGRLAEALNHYNQVLSLGQSSATLVSLGPVFKARLLANMGHAYRDLGDLVKARDSLQEAVRLDPDKFDPWMDLGFVEQKSGQPEEAVQAYSQALRIQSSDVGYLLLARALEQSGHQAESRAAIQRAKLVSRNFQAAQGMVDKMLAP